MRQCVMVSKACHIYDQKFGKCCHHKCRNMTLLEFKSKLKSWNPINCPCKLCKTYIGGVGYI